MQPSTRSQPPMWAIHECELPTQVSAKFPLGTRLWVRVPGSGRSPGVSWSFGLVKRRDMGQLVETYREGEHARSSALLCTLLRAVPVLLCLLLFLLQEALEERAAEGARVQDGATSGGAASEGVASAGAFKSAYTALSSPSSCTPALHCPCSMHS